MSTAYDLECADHGDTFDTQDQWTNQRELLVDLWRLRHMLPPETENPFDITVEWGGYKPISYSEREWIRTHANCHVRILDEYGRRTEFNGDPVPKKHDCPNCRCRPDAE